jgi:hypothetical protein
VKCQVISPGVGEACGQPATCLIVFSDGSTAKACQTCAINLQQIAEGVNSRISIRSLEDTPTPEDGSR